MGGGGWGGWWVWVGGGGGGGVGGGVVGGGGWGRHEARALGGPLADVYRDRRRRGHGREQPAPGHADPAGGGDEGRGAQRQVTHTQSLQPCLVNPSRSVPHFTPRDNSPPFPPLSPFSLHLKFQPTDPLPPSSPLLHPSKLPSIHPPLPYSSSLYLPPSFIHPSNQSVLIRTRENVVVWLEYSGGVLRIPDQLGA